jgi:oligopeptide/dipeptide ABC transporter ATP-binding protein
VAAEPRLLICDEAVSSLDGQVREQVLALLRDLQQSNGLSILFISHDLAVVEAISHRVAVMYSGRIVECGPAQQVFGSPAHPYTRALLASVPLPDPLQATPFVLDGEPPSPISPPAGCPFHPRCAHTVERCRAERPALRPFDRSEVACHRAEELPADRARGLGPAQSIDS